MAPPTNFAKVETVIKSRALLAPVESDIMNLVVGSRITVPKGTLAGRVANARGGKPAGAPGARTVSELEMENQQLRKELAKMRMERDIVKKRLRTLPGSRCKARAHDGIEALTRKMSA